MNILIIGTTDILGGAAKVSWELKNALQQRGHTVSMFVADKRSDDPNVKIIPRSLWRKCLGFLLGTENLINTDWILDIPEFKNADLVHAHNLHGRYFNLSTLKKMSLLKPVVWTLHDEWAITPHCALTLQGSAMRDGLYVCPNIDIPPRLLWDNSRRLARARVKLYEESLFNLVVPSHWLKERVEQTVLKKQNIRHIPNGIDTTKFIRIDKEAARRSLDLPLDKKIVLFLADDAKANIWKGWKYAQEMLDRYAARNDVLFLCVGNLTEHAEESNVLYRGHVRGPEALSRYYSAADVLLFTSIAENFPLVILEAMNCGLPIVTFDVGGAREAVIPEENGIVARYLDTEDLAHSLNVALSYTKEEQEQIAERSASRVRENFSRDLMIERYITLYDELIKDHG